MLLARTLRPFLLLSVVAALLGCAPRAETAGARGHAEHGRGSLFQRPWVWTDELGMPVDFAQWRGSPVVLTTIYTTCVRTCPRTVADLEKLSEAFRREGRDAHFVLVTLDPATDTPARLREYKTDHRLPDAWHLVVGTAGQTIELTDFLDVHVMDVDAHVFHEAKITIFNGDGVVVWTFASGDLDGATSVAVPHF